MTNEQRIALATRAAAFVSGAVDPTISTSTEAARIARRLVGAREKAAVLARQRDAAQVELTAIGAEATALVELLAEVIDEVDAAAKAAKPAPTKKHAARVRRTG